MEYSVIAAIGYGVLCVVVILFHLALAAGAPWGAYTMGGQWPGVLPVRVRFLSVVQAAILAAMAASVLDRAGAVALHWPAWAWWAAMAMTVLTFFANMVSRSQPERRLWVPVIAAMLVLGAFAR